MEELKIGYFIQELRKENQLTQVELAKILNVSNKAVSRWEVGDSNPDIYLLNKIAETFDITLDELFKGKKSKDTSINNKYKKFFYLNLIFFVILFILSIINSLLIVKNNDILSSFFIIQVDNNGSFAMTNIYFTNFLIILFLIVDIFIFLKLKFKGATNEKTN